MAEMIKRILCHSWDFADTTRGSEERLTDTVGEVQASLGYNTSLQSDGLLFSYGSSNIMKAYALMPDVFGRGYRVEVDVANFRPNWDSGSHGRFLMFDSTTTGFDEGLIYHSTRKMWSFYDSTNGWDSGFADLAKDAFNQKTVAVEVTEDGTTTLYLDGETVGTSQNLMPEKKQNLILGSDSRASTTMTISAVRVYRLETVLSITVRFYDMDGETVISEQEIEEGTDAEIPTPLVHEGYIFIGWEGTATGLQEDTNIYPLYRAIPQRPSLHFYAQAEDSAFSQLIESYYGVNACTITQKLDGECTISFTLLTRQLEGIVSLRDRLEVDGLVFSLTEIKKNISGGICYTQMTGEHISYLLNDERYMVTAYESTGTPRVILTELLEGTPFTVGQVDYTENITLRVNQESTRRACVMQLIALLGGEIEYSGYTIGIREHLGSTEPNEIMKTSLVQDISYTYNVSEATTNYDLSLYQKGNLNLGDELRIVFSPLALDAQNRIVGMEWNPFNYKDVKITVGTYLPTINDSLYEVVQSVESLQETTARYTLEFGEQVGPGTFFFTRAYHDRPYFHIHTSDGCAGTVTLNRRGDSVFGDYIGATLSGVSSDTSTLLVFYCTLSSEDSNG